MAQAGSARASAWIPFAWGVLSRTPRLEGHAHHLASPAYRQVLKAEPWLRRSIPVLIVTFVAMMTLTRLVGMMETRQALEDAARDQTALVASTLARALDQAKDRIADAGWEAIVRPLVAELPPRVAVDGRRILIADAEGIIRAAHPTDQRVLGKRLDDVLGSAQPLTTLGARAGAIGLTLADGSRAIAALAHAEGASASVAVHQPEEGIYEDWRRNLRSTLTLFAFTAVILLVLTYAYFAQVIRANSADALHALATARTETAFKRGRCGFWDWDLARGRFYWSASMFEMLGLDNADGSGLVGFGDVAKLVHPEDVDFTRFAGGLLTGEIHTLDRAFRMKKADGSWLWFRVRAEVVDRTETGSRHLVGIAADITEHRRLVETTVAADLRLRDAIETISEAFVLWDADNRLVMCNSKYQQLHGLRDGDIRPGAPYSQVMEVARQPLVRHPPAEEPADDGSSSFEAELDDGRWLQISERRTKDGGFVSVGTDITPLKRHEEKLVESEKRLMGTVLDLRSSRRKLEIQAQQLVELAEKYSEEKVRAEEANRIKSDFLANISHELRTPLNAIIGFSEIMSQGGMMGAFGPDKYAEYSRDIHHSGMFLLNVINDILDMSKIEAGRMELAHEEVPLDEILAEAGRIIAHAADDKKIEVAHDVQPGLSLEGDRRAVKQVVLNLLSNAVKFTPEGGRVSLAARSDGTAIRIAIVDTGIGISAEHIARLGQPFVQVENQFTKTHKGSGLGLAIARSLVELQGGTMTIASTPEVGTTVELTFPLGGRTAAKTEGAAGDASRAA